MVCDNFQKIWTHQYLSLYVGNIIFIPDNLVINECNSIIKCNIIFMITIATTMKLK